MLEKERSERSRKGFTLIELLIVIAIIAILAAIVFVSLDPVRRFRDARDSRRWAEVTAILSAIRIDQVDNGGSLISAVSNLNTGQYYMIGTDVAGCDDDNVNCDVSVFDDNNCVTLQGLASEGYLPDVPVSPTGVVTWNSGTTGYVMQVSTTGAIVVQACESENTGQVRVTR